MEMQNAVGKQSIYITRHHHDGGSSIVPCSLAWVGPEHLEDAIRLHDDVSHGVSPDIFAAFTHEDIARLFGPDGLAMGILFEGRLVSLRTVKTGADWVKCALESFGVACEEDQNPAVTGFCIVDREFRGNNVQFITQYMVEDAVSKSHTGLVTTVSPKNIFSLSNVLNCNFRIIGITKTYGNLLRYVLEKDFRPHQPRLMTHGHLQISIRDIKGQTKALSDGFKGYKLVRKSRGFHILYAEPGFPSD